MSFPKDFLFGAGSAAYQIEGGWNADGKGENIWDRLVHTKPDSVFNRDNGDIACDSYHLFKEDVACLKQAGLQVYRFSISWARILPNGEITSINEAGVKYYRDLIDELLKNGIQPMVTMYHWDLPQRLQDMGGWLNPNIVDLFVDYADLLFELFGDNVKWWITINEPRMIVSGYSGMGERNNAPDLRLDSPANYSVVYNLLKAHARVYRLYDDKYRATQKGKVGITNAALHFWSEDLEAIERAWAFELGIFTHAIFSEEGDFPELVKSRVAQHSEEEGRRRSRLPKFTEDDIKLIKGSSDFFGVNYYSTTFCVADEGPYPTLVSKDIAATYTWCNPWEGSQVNFKVVPWGLRELLRFIKDKYNNPPVFVTENGNCRDIKGEHVDFQIIDHHCDYLQEVAKARDEYQCNVIGYIAWPLLDNFEWNEGYKYRFGLYSVDFKDRQRKRDPKPSVRFFSQLVKTGSLPTCERRTNRGLDFPIN